MEREFYSLPEAAALLGISRIAVFKRVKKGVLPATRFGRNWAVPAAALSGGAGQPPSPLAPLSLAPARAKKAAGDLPPPSLSENIDDSLL